MSETPKAVVRCLVCGRKLTGEESIKRRIGTGCWNLLQSVRASKSKRKLLTKGRKKRGDVKVWQQGSLPLFGEVGCEQFDHGSNEAGDREGPAHGDTPEPDTLRQPVLDGDGAGDHNGQAPLPGTVD